MIKWAHIKSDSEAQSHYDEFYLERLDEMNSPDSYTNRRLHLFFLDLLGVPSDSDKKLLDVACGGGGFLYWAEQRVSCWGIDFSQVASDYAKKLLRKSRVEVGNVESLPYPDSEFDFVTCLGSLEHFHDMDKALREMNRVLKDDGKLLIHVPNAYFLLYVIRVWRHGDLLTPEQAEDRYDTINGWQRLIEQNGFRITRVEACNLKFPMRLSQFIKNPVRCIAQQLYPILTPKNLSYGFAYVACKEKR